MSKYKIETRSKQFRIKKSFLCFLFVVISFCFLSCNGIKAKLLVMEANMKASHQSQPQYTEAISAYSEALRYTEATPYAEYGLGLVYLFLGEDTSAFTRFDNASAMMDSELINQDDELNYRIHYNRGILHFQASHFDEAAFEFRNALEIDEDRIEAKRNLELSLLSMEQQNSAASSSPVEITSDQSKDNTLFDYLRQKEVDSWKAPEISEDQDSPWLDY